METHRKFREPKLLLGTSNEGKVRELSLLLNPFGIDTLPVNLLDIVEPEETGQTFEENSSAKALFYARETGLPTLADDSGLCVNALEGAPGIYSARWAGPERDYTMARNRIQVELEGKDDRSAYFECALCLAWPDGHLEKFRGRIDGSISKDEKGKNGFAYDPIFIPKGRTQTFAELGDQEKCTMSHRALALELLITGCLTE